MKPHCPRVNKWLKPIPFVCAGVRIRSHVDIRSALVSVDHHLRRQTGIANAQQRRSIRLAQYDPLLVA